MNNSRIIALITTFLLLVSMAGLISAQTFIAGKIYNADFSTEIEGASVTATCSGNSLSTTSLIDGTYGIGFEVSDCNESGTSVTVSAVKGSLSGSAIGSLTIDANSSYDYLSVINLRMIDTPAPSLSSGGGGGGGGGGGTVKYYLCGNGKCDTGETADTCPKDCKTAVTNSFETLSTETENENEQETIQQEEQTAGISGITGAIIGALGGGTGIILIIFILGLMAVLIAVRSAKAREGKAKIKTEE